MAFLPEKWARWEETSLLPAGEKKAPHRLHVGELLAWSNRLALYGGWPKLTRQGCILPSFSVVAFPWWSEEEVSDTRTRCLSHCPSLLNQSSSTEKQTRKKILVKKILFFSPLLPRPPSRFTSMEEQTSTVLRHVDELVAVSLTLRALTEVEHNWHKIFLSSPFPCLFPPECWNSGFCTRPSIRLATYVFAYASPFLLQDIAKTRHASSTLDWNGNHSTGPEEIQNFYMNFVPLTKHEIESYDCQQLPGLDCFSFVVNITGQVIIQHNKKKFIHNLIIIKGDQVCYSFYLLSVTVISLFLFELYFHFSFIFSDLIDLFHFYFL